MLHTYITYYHINLKTIHMDSELPYFSFMKPQCSFVKNRALILDTSIPYQTMAIEKHSNQCISLVHDA